MFTGSQYGVKLTESIHIQAGKRSGFKQLLIFQGLGRIKLYCNGSRNQGYEEVWSLIDTALLTEALWLHIVILVKLCFYWYSLVCLWEIFSLNCSQMQLFQQPWLYEDCIAGIVYLYTSKVLLTGHVYICTQPILMCI